MLIFNPTVAGTFTYNDLANSPIQFARGALANTVTGGFVIAGGFLESGGPQTGSAESDSASLDTAILLGSLIDGTADQIVLCARPINSSTNVDIEAGLTWREIV